jgi:hypothetical protein
MNVSISPATPPFFCQSIAGVLTVNLQAADIDLGPEILGLREVSMVCSSFDGGHYWPDDPLIAEPTARAKPRK